MMEKIKEAFQYIDPEMLVDRLNYVQLLRIDVTGQQLENFVKILFLLSITRSM